MTINLLYLKMGITVSILYLLLISEIVYNN